MGVKPDPSFLLGNLNGRHHLGKTWIRSEKNMEMDIKEVRCNGVGQFRLAHDGEQWKVPANTVVNLWVEKKKEMKLLG
jgi:hypothetical protein